MAARTDNRLHDAPMVAVSCGACGARVEARKSSWEQTSIQWDAESLRTCAERRAALGGPGPSSFTGCRALGTAIGEAAVSGRIRVRSDEPEPPDLP
ncbi:MULTISPECIES: ferredoxin [unclassified Streptomyces]|uniref:ferredoxin n=1 Tax=unclassified Streptomyces TaxID=2593676 RepID=UPI00278C7FE5|nr:MULTISPECIES: ferredoxin [unclassified Streptomyces]